VDVGLIGFFGIKTTDELFRMGRFVLKPDIRTTDEIAKIGVFIAGTLILGEFVYCV
jgi:hypothetical protein